MQIQFSCLLAQFRCEIHADHFGTICTLAVLAPYEAGITRIRGFFSLPLGRDWCLKALRQVCHAKEVFLCYYIPHVRLIFTLHCSALSHYISRALSSCVLSHLAGAKSSHAKMLSTQSSLIPYTVRVDRRSISHTSQHCPLHAMPSVSNSKYVI